MLLGLNARRPYQRSSFQLDLKSIRDSTRSIRHYRCVRFRSRPEGMAGGHVVRSTSSYHVRQFSSPLVQACFRLSLYANLMCMSRITFATFDVSRAGAFSGKTTPLSCSPAACIRASMPSPLVNEYALTYFDRACTTKA
jgi:hypothetical protein